MKKAILTGLLAIGVASTALADRGSRYVSVPVPPVPKGLPTPPLPRHLPVPPVPRFLPAPPVPSFEVHGRYSSGGHYYSRHRSHYYAPVYIPPAPVVYHRPVVVAPYCPPPVYVPAPPVVYSAPAPVVVAPVWNPPVCAPSYYGGSGLSISFSYSR